MNIAIKGTNIALTDAIRSYTENRLSHIEKFVSSPDTICRVELGKTTRHHKNGEYFRAEVKINIDGQEYYVTSEKEDLYAAIDDIKDGLTNKITSSKEKRQTFLKRSGAKLKAMTKGFWPNK